MRVISYRQKGSPSVGVMTSDKDFVSLANAAPELPDNLRTILAVDPDLEAVRAATEGKPADMSIDDIDIFEVNEASTLIQEAAHEDANIIFGAVIDETMEDKLRITVLSLIHI